MRRRVLMLILVVASLLTLLGAVVSMAAAGIETGQALSQAAHAEGRLLVRFRPLATDALARGVLAGDGLAVIGRIDAIDVYVVSVPAGREAEVARELKRNLAVAYAEPDYIVRALRVPDDPYFAIEQWNLAQIGGPAAWDLTTGSASVVIAVVDTGVDIGHPDLASKIVAGYDFVNLDTDPQDDEGHGSHVAGIAAAVSNNTVGVSGVSWGAAIMPVKVLDDSGSGYTSDVAAGIAWAADHGARVINLSLGGPGASQTLQDAVDHAYSAGALIVAAAGNDYSSGNPVNYPAACEHVVGVAATNDQDGHASYSSAGSWVDVAAPGGDPTGSSDPNPRHWIMSTYWRGAVAASAEPQAIQAAYERHAGTSMATPHVAGLAALVWSRHPEWTHDQVAWAIESTALDRGAAGRDDLFGWGRIDAGAAVALEVLQPTPTPTPSTCLIESAHPYENNTDRTWTITNTDTTAVYSRIHFSRLETESGYDPVIIMDATGTEVQRLSGPFPSGVWSAPVPGATVQVQLRTDNSITGWGFCVDSIASTAPPPWAIRAPLDIPRSRLALAAVDGVLYAIGGESADPASAAAKPAQVSPPRPRSQEAPLGVRAYDGVVEAYDPASNTWTRKAAMPSGVSNIAAGVIDGKIYVPGGFNTAGDSAALQVYDPAADTWTMRADLPESRAGAAVAALDGKLYVIGGTGPAGVTASCLRYDPAADAWSACSPMAAARSWAAAGVAGGRLYVAGGLDANDNELRTLEEYDPSANTWTSRASMSAARGGPGAVGLGDHLYVIGGGWTNYLGSMERYDPSSNRWATLEPMNIARRTMGVAASDGKIYATGGYDGDFTAAHEAYTPQAPVPQPNIGVAPRELSASVPVNGTAQQTLVISNSGQATLTLSITDVDTTPGAVISIHLPQASMTSDHSGQKSASGGLKTGAASELRANRGLAANAVVSVLIVTVDPDVSDLQASLAAFPDLQVAVYNDAVVPTLGQLQAYDVVLTNDNRYWAAGGIDPTDLGNVLADYVDAGGRVVVANYGYDYDRWAILGRFLDEDYGPFERASADLSNDVELGDFTADHPIMQGVTTLGDTGIHQDQTVGAGATLVASWNDGTPLVATRPWVVGINLLGSLGDGTHGWTGDAPTLFHNAIVWVSGGVGVGDAAWLSETPDAGAVPAGGSAEVIVGFAAGGLASGRYTANLLISSNDPGNPQVVVPVTMTVGSPGQASIYVDPATRLAGPGGYFTVSLKIASGGQDVDAVDARLSFDPTYLRVVDSDGEETDRIVPGTALPTVLQNEADNSLGRIAYSAGRELSGTVPSGDFALGIVRFKALTLTQEAGTPLRFISGTEAYFGGDPILDERRDGVVYVQPPVLVGSTLLQGRGQPPSDRWAGYDVQIMLYPSGVATATQTYAAQLDASGQFTVAGMSTGEYDVIVKGPHSLSNRKVAIVLPREDLPVEFGPLLEGDANGDDVVAGDDFSILAAAYATAPGDPLWDARADFNGDDLINGADFSLLVTNYGRLGPTWTARIGIARVDGATIRAISPGRAVALGSLFEVALEVWSPDVGVDAVDAYLEYDPSYLSVVDAAVAPDQPLPVVLQNAIHPGSGTIALSVGRALEGSAPDGLLNVAVLRFRAVQPTGPDGTAIRFGTRTGVYSRGEAMLGAAVNGAVIVAPWTRDVLFLPQVMR
jgi:subtilisin family serine protease